MAMEPPFYVLLDMDEGKGVRRLCRHVDADVAGIANIATGDRTKDTGEMMPYLSAFRLLKSRKKEMISSRFILSRICYHRNCPKHNMN